MDSEAANPVGDTVEVPARSDPSKRNPGKVPRKIHKAAREKLKRDRMNDLFSDLGKALDLDNPNNGKACILRETIRLLRELLTQIDNLKQENETLLSESNYATVEKNELLEETCALNAQIKQLQKELDGRANCTNFDVSQPQSNATTELPEDHVAFPPGAHASELTSVLGPLFVTPLHQDSKGFPCPFPEVNMAKVPSSVSRPQPRYPSSSDSWPSHILTRQTDVIEDA